MKALTICIFTLSLASFISTEITDKTPATIFFELIDACLVENYAVHEDIFHKREDFVNKIYEQPEMKDRKRLNGCVMACVLRKTNMMEGWEFKVDKILEKLPQYVHFKGNVNELNNIIPNCIQESKDVIPECEKVFTTVICIGESMLTMKTE